MHESILQLFNKKLDWFEICINVLLTFMIIWKKPQGHFPCLFAGEIFPPSLRGFHFLSVLLYRRHVFILQKYHFQSQSCFLVPFFYSVRLLLSWQIDMQDAAYLFWLVLYYLFLMLTDGINNGHIGLTLFQILQFVRCLEKLQECQSDMVIHSGPLLLPIQ